MMKRKRAFTLVELLIALALIGFIISAGTNLVMFGMRAHERTLDEFDIQSNIRLMSFAVNQQVRDASGIYLLDKAYPAVGADLSLHFTEGWNYMMLNDDKTQLVEWVWNGTTHVERIIATATGNVTYDLVYNKYGSADDDRLLEYVLKAFVDGREVEIVSEVESVNTLQVMDRSYSATANTIAYRNDARLTDVGVAQAAVSFVIDVSGSMAWRMGGSNNANDSSSIPAHHSRMKIMKGEAVKMIQGLSENENVYLSISPFHTHANAAIGSNFHTMLPLKTNLQTFIGPYGIVTNLTANGVTNTGDGMRRGFHAIQEFADRPDNLGKLTKNFMIILVDGESNYASVHELITRDIQITSNPLPHSVTVSGVTYAYHSYRWEGFLWWGNYVFTYREVGGTRTYTVNNNPVAHTGVYNGRTYEYIGWNSSSSGRFDYRHPSGPYADFVLNDQNIDVNSAANNTYYSNGRYTSTYYNEYINAVGALIDDFRVSRDDDIKVFVIGFTSDISPVGLEQIANAAGADVIPSTGKKYYVADSDAALQAVLDDIKFQISEALWHIGGPN